MQFFNSQHFTGHTSLPAPALWLWNVLKYFTPENHSAKCYRLLWTLVVIVIPSSLTLSNLDSLQALFFSQHILLFFSFCPRPCFNLSSFHSRPFFLNNNFWAWDIYLFNQIVLLGKRISPCGISEFIFFISSF